MPAEPCLSVVMPCYNEQAAIPYTIPQLVQAFERAGHRLELIGCDNGSRDRTGEILKEFAAQGLPCAIAVSLGETRIIVATVDGFAADASSLLALVIVWTLSALIRFLERRLALPEAL